MSDSASQPAPKQVAVLGATGSIGQSTLDVLAHLGSRFAAHALTGHTKLDRLVQSAQQVRPRFVVATSPELAAARDWSDLPAGTELRMGREALLELVTAPDVDIVLAAIVGRAGLESTLAAIDAGKRVALANKETLVVAGPLVMDRVAESGAELIPVDSEHSAIFQAMQAGRRGDLERVVLTASGGPFRHHTPQQLQRVTVEEALRHPTWEMGKKITVDSATMMNKALEIIEARWLFDLSPDQIDVVIHPTSVIHSFVEFADGSVLAQLSPPDMRLPIQYALSYPERLPSPAARFDWSKGGTFELEPADPDRFPALELGTQVARQGGTAGAVLNAANEAAVTRFLEGSLPFHQIVPACRSVLTHHTFDAHPTLEDLIRLDQWARQEIQTWK